MLNGHFPYWLAGVSRWKLTITIIKTENQTNDIFLQLTKMALQDNFRIWPGGVMLYKLDFDEDEQVYGEQLKD